MKFIAPGILQKTISPKFLEALKDGCKTYSFPARRAYRDKIAPQGNPRRVKELHAMHSWSQCRKTVFLVSGWEYGKGHPRLNCEPSWKHIRINIKAMVGHFRLKEGKWIEWDGEPFTSRDYPSFAEHSAMLNRATVEDFKRYFMPAPEIHELPKPRQQDPALIGQRLEMGWKVYTMEGAEGATIQSPCESVEYFIPGGMWKTIAPKMRQIQPRQTYKGTKFFKMIT